MKKKGRFVSGKKKRRTNKLTVVLSCIAGALALLVLILILLIPSTQNKEEATQPEVPATTQTEATQATEDTTVPTTEPAAETTVPVETEPTILPELADIYAGNPDLAGWVTIEGTVLDYPVMYTPDDGEKYLYKNINGNFDANGLPFIEDGCSMDPESDNIIIYGHNMKSGKMFASLMNYAKKEYWEEHPTILFSTLYENREYEIVAAFYDRVYYKYEDCFKFYQFIDAEDEAHYEEAISYFKENAEYDTGVTAEYEDKLLTLVTCAYHVKNGRFVVVAREIPADQ